MPQVITKDDTATAADSAVQAEAAQAALAGFASVDEPEVKPERAPEKKPEPQKTKAEETAEAKIADEAAAKAALEAEWDGVPAKVRQSLEAISGKMGAVDKLQHDFKSLAGRTGAALEGVNAIKTALEAAKTVKQAGGEAPTKEQIAAASENDAEWEKLKEDFPEWAEGTDRRIDRRVEERLAKLVIPPAVDADGLKKELTGTMQEIVAQATSKAKAEARELAKLDLKHEGWEETVKAPEFAAWQQTQAPELQALAQSNKAADAIKMLDAYAAHRRTVAEATEKAERSKKRLEGAITPKGVATPATRNISEDEAKFQGFASVDE